MLLQLNTIRFELNQSIILTLPRRFVAKVDPDDRESQVRTLEMMTRVCISLFSRAAFSGASVHLGGTMVRAAAQLEQVTWPIIQPASMVD